MSEGRRRLAAIMFTDIVGYTAITQTSESHAMQLLQQQNELFRPLFREHNGREIKSIGDAHLVEFDSALEAVLCSVKIQELLNNYNEDPSNKKTQFKVRIGIHIGDVIHREGDVYGDAVNIASRIETLAEPGGVCLSGQVRDQVQNKIPFSLLKLENPQLKNVLFRVDAYQIVLPWQPAPGASTRIGTFSPDGAGTVPLKRRLAILPLSNMSRDPDEQYFADGMTDELINVISQVRDLRVIARSSVMGYKGTSKRASEIGKELNVGSILEGSVRKAGNRIRVTVQVVDVGTEEHQWAMNYDRDLSDIFSVQSDIAKQVSRTLKAKLHSNEKQRIGRKLTENTDAYTYYVKGRVALHGRTRKAMEEAMEYFGRSISKDARFAKAYSGLADTILLMASYGYVDAKSAYKEARELVSTAIEFDEGLPEAHVSLGFLLESRYDFAGARSEFEHAIAMSPSYAQARHWYAINLAILGRLKEAIAELERAKESDPLSPQIGTVLGGFYTYEGRDEDALREWERVLKFSPDNVPVYLNRAIYFAHHGRREEALSDMDKALGLSSHSTVLMCVQGYVHAVLGEREEALKILKEIKSKAAAEKSADYVSPFYFAILHSGLGDQEEALNFLDRAIEDRSAEIESLLHDPMFQSLRSERRFGLLLEKIGLATGPMTQS